MNFDQELGEIWKMIDLSNKYIEEKKPWELIKNNPEEFQKVMEKLRGNLFLIAQRIKPFLPQTSQKMLHSLRTGESIILFPRFSQKNKEF